MNSGSESDSETNDYSDTRNFNENNLSDYVDLEQENNGKVSEGTLVSNRKRPSRFDENNSSEKSKNSSDEVAENVKISKKEIPKKHLTKDEILEEMSYMLKRTLTEILLEVTTEEIQATAEESLASVQRQKSKSVLNAKIRASRAFKKNPISSLGLTGYGTGSDDSASESEKSDKKSGDNTSDSDSDIELEERLKQRKRQFQRTETSILDECADLEKSLEKREKIWKERESENSRRRHESKNSNHSDQNDHRKTSPKVFETFSAAVDQSHTVSNESESRIVIYEKEERKVYKKQDMNPSSSHSKVKNISSKSDQANNANEFSSDDSQAFVKDKSKSVSMKDIKKSTRASKSPDEKYDKNERRHRSDTNLKERNKRSPSDTHDSEISERVYNST